MFPFFMISGVLMASVPFFFRPMPTVDGELADWNVDQGYWALYIGEDYATTGIDTTPIHDGDVFTLEYTIG